MRCSGPSWWLGSFVGSALLLSGCGSTAESEAPPCADCELVAEVSGVTAMVATSDAVFVSLSTGEISRIDVESGDVTELGRIASEDPVTPRLALGDDSLVWAEPISDQEFRLRTVPFEGGDITDGPALAGFPRLATGAGRILTSYRAKGTVPRNRVSVFDGVDGSESVLFETDAEQFQTEVWASGDLAHWCAEAEGGGAHWYSQTTGSQPMVSEQESSCFARSVGARTLQQTEGDDGEQCIEEIADDGGVTRLFCQPRIDALLELPDGSLVTVGDGKRLWRVTNGAAPKPWQELDSLPFELTQAGDYVYFSTLTAVRRVRWR